MGQVQKPGGIPVRIVKYTPSDREGALRGFFTVEVGKPGNALTIHDARHIQQQGQRSFCTPPQKSVMGDDGKRQYFPLVQWPRTWNDSIMDALEEHLRNQSGRLFGSRAA